MRRAHSQVAIVATLLLLAVLAAGCGSSGKREGQIGTSQTSSVVVQQGDPVLAAKPGYAGSETCAACHPNQFEGWGRSLHNAPLKTVAELGDGIFVNDANSNGANDFADGLDLATTSAFASFADNAPRLSTAGGRFFATIGAVAYEIQRTQGGNGYWKQRYHTRIGNSYYILPFQYNERTRQYVKYNDSHWYVGTVPHFTEPYGSAALVAQVGELGRTTGNLGTQRSWENRCAGCHQTGLTVDAQMTNYGGTAVQEAVTGYSELNIGCESCHGPGAAHVASRNPSDIVNPDNFKVLGVTGLRAANQVCGACHSRGESEVRILDNVPLGVTPLPLEYPARVVSGMLQFPTPGVNVVDNSTGNPYTVLNTSTAYYGTASADFGDGARDIYSGYRNWYDDYLGFPIYVASRQHHQQWTDVEQGPHSADGAGLTCFDCHDPHEGKGDHQVRNSITVAGTTLSSENDDNSLCLACHAGDFGLNANDVKNGGPAVGTAVLAHMGTEAVMGTVAYDPSGSGVGRCSKCHMPKTASSAIRTAVGTGLKEGDIHDHTFNILWPSANLRLPFVAGSDPAEMTGSCYSVGCHNNDPASAEYVSEIAEWSESGHADFTGEPFRHWDEDGEVSTSCAKCHSKPGFRDFAADGAVNAAAKLGTKISCGACHTEEGDGTTLWDRRGTYTALQNVRFPSGAMVTLDDDSNMCMACHQGRASKVDVDTAIAADNGVNRLTFVNNHYFAAAATLFGTVVRGGYEYDDNSSIGTRTYVGRFVHVSPVRDTCIDCHMGRASDLLENNHTFVPKTEYCVGCHASVPVPDDPGDETRFRSIRLFTAGIDFDGDGNATEGLYFEIWDTLVPALYTQVRTYASTVIGVPIVFAPGVHPYWFKDSNGNGIVDPGEAVSSNRYNVFDATLLKAAYNYGVVQNDPCGYIHNGLYVIQLLRDSIEDLSGTAPAGVRP